MHDAYLTRKLLTIDGSMPVMKGAFMGKGNVVDAETVEVVAEIVFGMSKVIFSIGCWSSTSKAGNRCPIPLEDSKIQT